MKRTLLQRLTRSGRFVLTGWMLVAGITQSNLLTAAENESKLPAKAEAAEVATEVDRLLEAGFAAEKVAPARKAGDEDFLRRASLDLTGTIPTSREVTLFGLDPSPDRRAKALERMLHSDAYADTWARYWRDVFFRRATNARAQLANDSFISWMRDNLKDGRAWDQIASDMITATGRVTDNGATALFFIQEGEVENVTGEVARVFLGIQMQCANCHDHPWDRWKREQFHELAAFFPRAGLRQETPMDFRSFAVVSVDADQGEPGQRLQMLKEGVDRTFAFADRNRDGRLSKEEAQFGPLGRQFELLVRIGDKDKDGALTKTEIKEMPEPMPMPGRGATEHFMSDLNNPAAKGKRMEPKFFLTSATPKTGLDDLDRRELFSQYLTSAQNEWFSKAFVNRMWAELTGHGFYSPVDDMGPDRTAVNPEVLELLSKQFAAHGYDIRWLMQTIALTATYQRQIQPVDESGKTPPFVAASPTRLRGDQVFQAFTTAVGVEPIQPRGFIRGPMAGGPGRLRSPRDQFGELFGFDPSTPQADITGTVPQALFFMNSPVVASQTKADGGTRLAEILKKYPNDKDAIAELYLMVLSREPSEKELTIASDYIASVNQRNEAFEDLLWSLLNSSEFLSRR